jgi:XTP/dITP diphosphohydrolase
MEIWVATGNEGKLKEIKQLLEPQIPDIKLHHQNELKAFTPRPEDGKTYLDNARIKAKTLKAVRDKDWVMADDSGLEVVGLGNLPGVHSARYAGPHARDSENTAKLLKMMTIRNVGDRKARFISCIVVITPDNQEWVFEGELWGTIAKLPQGMHGFGYDPVFIPDGQTQSLAELGPGFKMTSSHRTLALKKFLEKLNS